ncbi:unnamed protein product [Gordionus sp. m RMFG-2023]
MYCEAEKEILKLVQEHNQLFQKINNIGEINNKQKNNKDENNKLKYETQKQNGRFLDNLKEWSEAAKEYKVATLKDSSTFVTVTRFYVKTLFYGLVIFCVSLIWPVFLVTGHGKRNCRNQKIVYTLYYKVCRIFGIRYRILHKENATRDESAVIVSNHQSSLDLLSQSTVWPSNCTSVAKREVVYLGPFGALSYVTGVVYIDRKDLNSAKKTLADLAERMKIEKLKVWIFPEGTRNHGTGILPFKKGAFHLAVQAQVPICPVVFSSYYPFYCRYEKRFNSGIVLVTCLPPIPTKGMTTADVDQLTDHVRAVMLKVFVTTSAAISPPFFAKGSPLRARWEATEAAYRDRIRRKASENGVEYATSNDLTSFQKEPENNAIPKNKQINNDIINKQINDHVNDNGKSKLENEQKSADDDIISKIFEWERYQDGVTDPVTHFIDKKVGKFLFPRQK